MWRLFSILIGLLLLASWFGSITFWYIGLNYSAKDASTYSSAKTVFIFISFRKWYKPQQNKSKNLRKKKRKNFVKCICYCDILAWMDWATNDTFIAQRAFQQWQLQQTALSVIPAANGNASSAQPPASLSEWVTH